MKKNVLKMLSLFETPVENSNVPKTQEVKRRIITKKPITENNENLIINNKSETPKKIPSFKINPMVFFLNSLIKK